MHLQAFRLIGSNFTVKWSPSQVFFDSILSFPHVPLMFWLKPPSIKFWGTPTQWGWGRHRSGPQCRKTSFEVLERLNMKNRAIFELYTDDNKSKYSSNPKDILKSAKKIMKLYTKWTSTAATTEAVCKIPSKKISNEHFNLCETEISIDTFQMN